MKSNSLVFIDEPEISLHPNWQMKFLSFLREIFRNSEYSTCHIVVATHSHFLISDLEGSQANIIALSQSEEGPKARPIHRNTFGWSAEEVLYRVFNVRTTRNYYIEMNLKELLHLITIQSKNKQRLEYLYNKLSFIELTEEDPLKKILSSSKKYIDKI
jgi:predicted ATP-binding protein involved in virulence